MIGVPWIGIEYSCRMNPIFVWRVIPDVLRSGESEKNATTQKTPVNYIGTTQPFTTFSKLLGKDCDLEKQNKAQYHHQTLNRDVQSV